MLDEATRLSKLDMLVDEIYSLTLEDILYIIDKLINKSKKEINKNVK